jgi:dUTP pyrophosphatase
MLNFFKSGTELAIFKINEAAITPQYSTEASACFDIHACLPQSTRVKAKVKTNPLSRDTDAILPSNSDLTITLPPGARALIPTGLKFHIPKNHSLRLHPRSGHAFKNGITLVNCEGIIDEDYVDEVFVAVYNTSNEPFVIKHGDRICQAELVKDIKVNISESKVEPTKKTSRSGGFGSTGV